MALSKYVKLKATLHTRKASMPPRTAARCLVRSSWVGAGVVDGGDSDGDGAAVDADETDAVVVAVVAASAATVDGTAAAVAGAATVVAVGAGVASAVLTDFCGRTLLCFATAYSTSMLASTVHRSDQT